MSTTPSQSSSVDTSPSLVPQSALSRSPPSFILPNPAVSPAGKARNTSRSPPMSPIPEDGTFVAPPQVGSPDDETLRDVSLDIKSTLTDLLNCEAVRNDSRMRLWVQTRLMAAEMELKRQRRRRVSVPLVVMSPSCDGVERRVSR